MISSKIVSRENKGPYKVSVIIPVYNVQEYISDTIMSVLNQSLKGVEIIVVNDGSTDHSDEIIRTFLENYDSLVYVTQDNSGPGSARNTGIELANGEFVCFVDSDDLLPEDALEIMYTTALKEEADLVTGASISFSSNRDWFIQSHAHNGVYNAGPKSLLTHPELLYSVGPCNKMFKKELVRGLRFPEGIIITEDHPFMIEAYLKANKIFTIDKVIYKYRRRESTDNLSLSQSVRFNSPMVLRHVMKSMRLSDSLWDSYLKNEEERSFLKAFYYNRLILSDIWPAIIHILRNQYDQKNGRVIEEVIAWVSQMDSTILARLKKTKTAKKVKALETAHRENSLDPVKNRIFMDRCNKFKLLLYKKLQTYMGTKIIYPFMKRRKLEQKIIFISSKITSFKYYDEELKMALKRRWPDYEMKVWLIRQENLRDYLSCLYDLATAKIVVFDDYSNPFIMIKNRSQTELIERSLLQELKPRMATEVSSDKRYAKRQLNS